MSRVAHFRELQKYEEWASGKTLAALRSAEATQGDPEAFKRALGIFGHMQSARHEWLARLGRIQRRPWVMFPGWMIDEAAADAARLDGEWRTYLADLTDEVLDEDVRYTSNEGVPWVSVRREILTHVYNHSTYHRGQIAILVKLAGGTPPDTTDFIVNSRRPG
jgi:uncharacterized damage-inducible protein DinB